jgi:hypothetical protein
MANAVLAEPVAAQQPKSPKDCVDVSKSEIDDGLRFELKNHCDRVLACRVSWNLKCGDKPAKLQERGDEKFAVPADASHGVEATTEACGNRSWLIENVRWTCEGK